MRQAAVIAGLAYLLNPVADGLAWVVNQLSPYLWWERGPAGAGIVRQSGHEQ